MIAVIIWYNVDIANFRKKKDTDNQRPIVQWSKRIKVRWIFFFLAKITIKQSRKTQPLVLYFKKFFKCTMQADHHYIKFKINLLWNMKITFMINHIHKTKRVKINFLFKNLSNFVFQCISEDLLKVIFLV